MFRDWASRAVLVPGGRADVGCDNASEHADRHRGKVRANAVDADARAAKVQANAERYSRLHGDDPDHTTSGVVARSMQWVLSKLRVRR